MNLPENAPWVVFMFGLPGSGKTTWIDEKMRSSVTDKFNVVSADDLKDRITSSGNLAAGKDYHQISVKMAEEEFDKAIRQKKNIVFDGGGINNNYNIRLAEQAIEAGFYTQLVVLDTPASVCIERNEKRDRKIPVPAEQITRKSVIFQKCLDKLAEIVDAVETVNYYTNEYLFVDMDGTLAAYQYMPLDEYGCIDFANGEYFKNVDPVVSVIEKVDTYQRLGSEVHILSAIPDSECEQHKNDWLDTHTPFIGADRRHFIGNKKYKFVMLRNLIKRMKIDKRQVTLIDDDPRVLQSVNDIGVNAIHPSMFLTERY